MVSPEKPQLIIFFSFIHSFIRTENICIHMVSDTGIYAGYTTWNSKGICRTYKLPALLNLMFQGHNPAEFTCTSFHTYTHMLYLNWQNIPLPTILQPFSTTSAPSFQLCPLCCLLPVPHQSFLVPYLTHEVFCLCV